MKRRATILFFTLAVSLIATARSTTAAEPAPATSPAPAARAISPARPGAPTTARASKPREAIPTSGCVTADCHASVKQYKVVHGPIGVDACDACHELTSAQNHTFKLLREKAELCTYCHEFDVSAMPVVHEPVKKGECIGCHDPHGGPTRALVRENSMSDLCHRCHEDITLNRTFLHTPVKQGACDSCHPPHASRFPRLTDLAGPDLCLACHEAFDANLARVKFTHKALEQGCRKCHDVHGSKHSMATTQPVVEQCGGCHAKVMAEATNARYPHTPVTQDKACITCHTPHGGNLAKLVSDTPDKLCMTCHVKAQKIDGRRTVAALTELANPQWHRHGGIKDGSCAGCHSSHGGNRQLFLSKNYSSIFYQRFAPAQYELCFSCHEQKLVTETNTNNATAFRNGDKNLHALHVRDTRERGENCRNCHANHASPNDRLVRDIVIYGTWKMPVRFKKTASGGSCFPGCHPTYGYDREQPVKNTIGSPTTQDAMPLGRERPATIAIDATDYAGKPVRIPEGSRPVIIAIARTDDDVEQVRNALTVALAGRADARLIVLLERITDPATQPAKTWPADASLIADPDASLAAELDVRGFPTVLVLKPDGAEIARISGSAESLAVKLPAYLDLASGKIASADVEAKLSMKQLLGDGANTQTARDARTIELLLDTGKPDQALKMLGNLPKDALPNWRHNYLGARALIGLGRWTEAKDAADAALRQNPDFRQTHFLLGQIAEQSQDWPRAASEYRKALGAGN